MVLFMTHGTAHRNVCITHGKFDKLRVYKLYTVWYNEITNKTNA